jgi:antitoxin CptB
MTGTTTTSEGLDVRRRRLLFHCWHRGTREMDLIMGRFADAVIRALSEEEVGALEHLAEAQDQDVYAWIAGDRPVTPDYDTAMYRRLVQFVRDNPVG